MQGLGLGYNLQLKRADLIAKKIVYKVSSLCRALYKIDLLL